MPKKPANATSDLPVAPLPQLLEYKVNGVAWRISRFDLLAAELGDPPLSDDHLNLLQDQLAGKERAWLIVRRLFGMMPVRPSADLSLDDMRLWGRDELQTALGITRAQLQQELDGVRGMWRAIAPAPVVKTSAVVPPANEPTQPEFVMADDAIFKKHDFRVAFKDHDEKQWFLSRVLQFEKMLHEKMTSGLARNTLMTELQIRRLDEDLANPNGRLGSQWNANMKLRETLNNTYQKQMDSFPAWASELAGKYSFKAVLSDVTASMQEYYGRGDTELIDGIFTLAETRVEMRRSVQMPDPRYRAGLVVFLNMAKSGLFDPKFKNQFPLGLFRQMDESWKTTCVSVGVGDHVPDLEKDGKEGEYDELKQ